MDTQNEIWKPIAGYENYYEVSSLGRVRRVKEWAHRQASSPRLMTVRYVGYTPQVSLCRQGVRKGINVRNLVYSAFVEPVTSGALIRHRNGDKTDLRPENLYLRSLRITRETAEAIRADYATGQFTMKALGNRHGVSAVTIFGIIHHLIWKDREYRI